MTMYEMKFTKNSLKIADELPEKSCHKTAVLTDVIGQLLEEIVPDKFSILLLKFTLLIFL